jgi:peroxiredoxin Q/BCP
VAYFAASIDKPETNRAFAESLELDYPILSDPGKQTARAYGVLRVMGLLAARHTFVIDSNGTILDINTRVRSRSAGEQLIARLESLGIARRT